MRKLTYMITLMFCASLSSSLAQDNSILNKSIEKPSVLSTHVFGIFSGRLQGHFKSKTNDNLSIQLDHMSGNVWGQPVENYIPTTESLRERAADIVWHGREFSFDRIDLDFQENTENFNIAYDGVIKGLMGTLYIPINEKNALQVELRSFILTGGRLPFTGITGDNFIETFHSNVAGGEDPFQRREFGLNQAQVDYTDRQGREMQIKANEAFFGGVKLDYYSYFEDLLNYNIHFNIGLHSGINASPFNKSIDLGISANAFRNFEISDNKYLQLGLNLGYLHLQTASLSRDNIEFATRPGFFNLESVLTYNVINTKGDTHSFGVDFYIQTAYHSPSEYDYSILFRNDLAIRSWHQSVSSLYLNNNYWTFFYAFTQKNSFRIYLQQDWLVNNNPDLQTGLGYVINF